MDERSGDDVTRLCREITRVLDQPGPAAPEAHALATLVRAAPDDRAAPRLVAALEVLEARAFDLARFRHDLADADSLLRALELIDAFRDLAIPVLGDAVPDAFAEARSEAEFLAGTTAAGAGVASVDALARRLDALLVDRLERAAGLPPPPNEPALLLQLAGSPAAESAARSNPATRELIERTRRAAWRHLDTAAEDGDAGRKRDLVRRLADGVLDHAEDVLARSEGLPGEAPILAIASARRDVEATLELQKKHRAASRARPLRQMRTRLAAMESDQRVRFEQSRRVGTRGRLLLDRAVFAAITGLVLILGVHAFATPGERLSDALDLADALLALFLLAEFGWRWALSGFGARYLLRHLFTDVLPSLPFGLLGLAARYPDAIVAEIARFGQALRVLRPAIVAWRLIAFALQAMDRFVRRHATMLNRNFVLFDAPAEDETGAVSPDRRLAHLYERAVRAFRLTMAARPAEERARLASARAAALGRRLDHAALCELGVDSARHASPRDVRVESLIEDLMTLDQATILDRVGPSEAERWARFLRFFDAPVLRSLPLFRRIVPGLRRLPALEALMRAGRAAGRLLEGWIDRVRAAADLHGIVTGPQLLDRLGGALVKATQRPAVRLILLGFFLSLVSLIVGLFGADSGSMLWRLNRLLKNVLGTPLLVLGGICLVLQAFGRWIRHLAGEATDLYQKVAEAQGIDLLKFTKRDHRERDLALLFDRVLGAEIAERGDEDEQVLAEERARFVATDPYDLRSLLGTSRLVHVREQLLLAWIDYLDGGILHWSNVKTLEQFLGNLDLEAVRVQRLATPRREIARQNRQLDVQKERALPTGPYLWFTFITESLAQKTAKLVLEYNEHCVPDAHRGLVPLAAVNAMERWLAEREEGSQRRPPSLLPGDDLHGCVRFTALHFLDDDPERDEAVRQQFGDRVLARLRADRRDLLRSVFSSYPCDEWPRHRRTLNPYALYFRWFGRGRVLVLPLRALVLVGFSFWRFGSFLSRVIREELRPTDLRLAPAARAADRETALRKINRMHRPLYMATLELRARFDPAYLGLPIPGRDAAVAGAARLVADLDLVGAREYERERFRSMTDDALAFSGRLYAFLERAGFPGRPLEVVLDPELPPGSSGTPPEAARAVLIAYLVDYQGARTLLHGGEDLRGRFEAATRESTLRPRMRPLRSALERGLRSILAEAGLDARPPEELARIRQAVATDWQGVRTLLARVVQGGGAVAAAAEGRRLLAQVARYPAPWSQQLVAVRAVQATAVLDLLNTRRLVTRLGGYGASPIADAASAPRSAAAPIAD